MSAEATGSVPEESRRHHRLAILLAMAMFVLVLSPAEQQRVAQGLEENAEVMTNTHLAELLAGQPPDVQKEILRINSDARPIALQIALLIPLIAALLGLVNGFRMTRLPDPEPSSAAEGALIA